MRIYLNKDGLQYIGYGRFPNVIGDRITLIAKREPMVMAVIGYEPACIKMETKMFEIKKFASGCSPMSGFHKGILLEDEKDIEKYFSKIEKA